MAAENRMNLSALQQRDPYITDIVDTASQVALYSFNSKSNEWVRYLQFVILLARNQSSFGRHFHQLKNFVIESSVKKAVQPNCACRLSDISPTVPIVYNPETDFNQVANLFARMNL